MAPYDNSLFNGKSDLKRKPTLWEFRAWGLRFGSRVFARV